MALLDRLGIKGGSLFQTLVMAGVIGIVSFLVIVPVSYLVWVTFLEGGPSLESFRAAYDDPQAIETLWNSLVFAGGSMIVALTMGAGMAYLTVRTDIRFKVFIFVSFFGALIMPGMLYAMAWLVLAAPRSGILNGMLEPLAGPEFFNVFTMPGMILVSALHLAPIIYLLFVAALRSFDPALEEAAFISGASTPGILRRITYPLLRPTVFAGAILMFIIGLEVFEIPAIIGIPGGEWVFTARIWRVLQGFPPAYGEAGAFAFTMLGIIIVAVAIQARFTRRGRQYQTITGKGFRPREIELGRWKWPATLLALGVVGVAFVLPMLGVIYASTQRFLSTPSIDSIASSTLEPYRELFRNPLMLRSIRNTVLLAVGSATIIMALMSVGAWIVVKSKLPGRWLLDGIATVPLVIPGLILGVGLLVFYLRVPLPVFGTLWLMLIAYVTRYMPFGMRYAATSMYQIGSELEEAAAVCGATWWQTFRKVYLPLLAPGLLAGWSFIMVMTSRDLGTVVLLFAPGTEVVSTTMFQNWSDGLVSRASALGVLLVGALVLIVTIAQRIGRRYGLRLI